MTKTPSFVVAWEAKQGRLLEELTAAKAKVDDRVYEEEMRALIARAVGQLEEYYEEKSRAATRDVFSMFSPEWCSPLECAFYWISGLRPTAMIRLVSAAVDDLSTDQLLRLESLKSEKRLEENALSNEQARIQGSIATLPMTHLLHHAGWHPNGFEYGDPQSDVAMKTVEDALEALMGDADTLRGRTTTSIVEILTVKQTILALEAMIRLQRNIKIWGMEKQRNSGLGAKV